MTQLAVRDQLLPGCAQHLGFGCASLLDQRGTRAEALRLLNTALDAGVHYFDTARMYGSGQAEALLGAVAKGRRDELVIVSKAGISPRRRDFAVRALGKVSTIAGRVSSGLGRRLQPSSARPTFGLFAPDQIRDSVETSLRELGTDYIDVLLMHEMQLGQLSEELLRLLETLRTSGKVRFYGLATGIEDSNALIAAAPAIGQVVQIPSSAWAGNIHQLVRPPGSLAAIHSALGSRFHRLATRLASEPPLAKRFNLALGVDVGEPNTLGRLFLAHALHSNPDGVVLFSSSRAETIARNAAFALAPDVTPGQSATLARLIAEEALVPAQAS